MIFCYTDRFVANPIVIRELFPAINGNRCRAHWVVLVEITQEKERKDYRSQRNKGNCKKIHNNQLTWDHSHSQRLIHQPGSLHGSDLGSPQLCYSCIAWSSCGILNHGSLYLGPCPATELPPLASVVFL